MQFLQGARHLPPLTGEKANTSSSSHHHLIAFILLSRSLSTPSPHHHQNLSPLLETLKQDHPPHLLNYAPIFQLLTRDAATAASLRRGRQLHAHLTLHGLHPNAYLAAKMVAMYSSSDDLHSASTLFNQVREPSTLLYNSIIRGHSIFGTPEQTLILFHQMHSRSLAPDHFTFPFVLKCCAQIPSLPAGQSLHSQCLRGGFERDLYVGTSLIDMYVKCGEIRCARRLFDVMIVRDLSSWNALIAGYMKIGEVVVAQELFERMPSRNIVSWTAMVSGFAQNGMADHALGLFEEMVNDCSEVKPNWVTIVSVLPACAHSAALDYGKRIHDYARCIGADRNYSVKIALVAMYAKCGSLVDARQCFDQIGETEKGLVAWNTMITAYASHGCGLEALATFEDMMNSGVQPDAISFTGLLSGCSHSGLVDRGLKYFNCMSTVYSLEPRSEHYACVVDLLSRAGRFVEAKDLIDHMTIEAGASVWGALLAASRTHRNMEIAELAAKKLFVLEPYNCGNYVLLSNLYAEVGRWEEVNELRALLKDKGMRKTPGCSWTEINGRAYAFLGGDKSHPQAAEIYKLLEDIPKRTRAAGYVPDTSFVLHDVSEEEKECNLNTHSEKLAVAFGLLNTLPGSVLRVTKNLRICGDCHTVIKFISSIYAREIIVRDVNRFHHFKDGSCSCRDYW